MPKETEIPKATATAAKATIPKALREQVWLHYVGKRYECKCIIPWCTNKMTVFDFHVGHNVPESVGGATELANLRPICARCNLSMGATYTIQEWSRLSAPAGRSWCCLPTLCGGGGLNVRPSQ